MANFLTSSKVLGRLDQPQVIWLLYIMELLAHLIDLGYSNCSTWYIQSFWQGLACWAFPQTFALWNFGSLLWPYFVFFSIIDAFQWFWIGSSHKNFHLVLEFFTVPFLDLHFSYYTLMTLVMLSVTSRSMLMILLSTPSVIKHLIYCNN